MKTIAIKNGKGGCGKSTATINISAILAKVYNKRVLVIDTDGRAHTTKMYIENTNINQIGQAMLGKINIQDCIQTTRFQNIDIIGCGEEVQDDMKELEKKLLMDPMHRMSVLLNELGKTNKYDYCIIDCSQDADLMAVNILLSTDFILIPARCDAYSKDGIEKMLEWISQIESARNRTLKYSVFIADLERNKENQLTHAELKSLLDNNLCLSTIRHQSKAVQHSIQPNIRIPFVLEKKPAGVATDYLLLVKELIENEKI